MPVIQFVVNVEPDPEDGGYIAATPMLAGVYGQGNTKRQAVDDLEEALVFTLDSVSATAQNMGTGPATLTVQILEGDMVRKEATTTAEYGVASTTWTPGEQ